VVEQQVSRRLLADDVTPQLCVKQLAGPGEKGLQRVSRVAEQDGQADVTQIQAAAVVVGECGEERI